jgi:hypothetical protein
MILRVVLTSSYEYRYGHSDGHDFRNGFRANCAISSHGPVNIYNHLLVLLIVTPGLLSCGQVDGTKVS